LKLVDLCEEGQKRFWADEISAAIALLLARIPAEQQREALDSHWATSTTRDLQRWLTQNVYLDLHQAPWKKDDAELVPRAGSCVDCTKRTGFAPALFNDIAKADTCTDPQCFAMKKAAFVDLKKAELAAKAPDVIHVSGEWGQYGKPRRDGLPTRHDYIELPKSEAKGDPAAKKALVVDGDGAGRVIYIKTTKGNGGGAAKSDKEKAEAKKAKLEDKIRRETAGRSVAAIVEEVSNFALLVMDATPPGRRGEELLRFVVTRMWERAWNDLRVLIINRRGFEGSRESKTAAMEQWIKGATPEALAGLLVELALGAHNDYHQAPMKAAAELVKVDLAAIAKATRDELAGAVKPKGKKTSAKAAEGKPAKKAAAKKAVKKTAAKKAAKKKKNAT
jgi:ParB family chromosome partitioning protein